jgi:hypothetical protein
MRYLFLIVSSLFLLRIDFVSADWLVIESNAPAYDDYQLLPESSQITLKQGETLHLLHDDGSQRSLRGPQSLNLNSLRNGSESKDTAGGGITERLASILESQNRMAIPLTTRSGLTAKSASSIPEGAIDINKAETRCISDQDDIVLARQSRQAMKTAYVEVRKYDGLLEKLTWHAGFDTLNFKLSGFGVDSSQVLKLKLSQGSGPDRYLEITVIPTHMPLQEQLEMMLEADCRSDISQKLDALASKR